MEQRQGENDTAFPPNPSEFSEDRLIKQNASLPSTSSSSLPSIPVSDMMQLPTYSIPMQYNIPEFVPFSLAYGNISHNNVAVNNHGLQQHAMHPYYHYLQQQQLQHQQQLQYHHNSDSLMNNMHHPHNALMNYPSDGVLPPHEEQSAPSTIVQQDKRYNLNMAATANPAWKKKFMDSFKADKRWENRIDAVSEIQLLSMSQDRTAMVHKKNKGGRSLVLQCTSTVRKNYPCPFYAKLRRSAKDHLWYIAAGLSTLHQCALDPGVNNKKIGALLAVREENLVKADLHDRKVAAASANISANEALTPSINSATSGENVETSEEGMALIHPTADNIEASDSIEKVNSNSDSSGEKGPPTSSSDCPAGLDASTAAPEGHGPISTVQSGASSAQDNNGYPPFTSEATQIVPPRTKTTHCVYHCSLCGSDTHTRPTCPANPNPKRSAASRRAALTAASNLQRQMTNSTLSNKEASTNGMLTGAAPGPPASTASQIPVTPSHLLAPFDSSTQHVRKAQRLNWPDVPLAAGANAGLVSAVPPSSGQFADAGNATDKGNMMGYGPLASDSAYYTQPYYYSVHQQQAQQQHQRTQYSVSAPQPTPVIPSTTSSPSSTAPTAAPVTSTDTFTSL